MPRRRPYGYVHIKGRNMFKRKVFPRNRLQDVRIVPHVDYAPTFFYPLAQGCPEEPQIAVKTGQSVNPGDALAHKTKPNTQHVHTAVGGTVKSIRKFRYSGNYESTKAVEIAFGGKLSTFKKKEKASLDTLKREQIIARIENAGIFDADAGPVEAALKRAEKNSISRIIINAVEQRPFLMAEEKIISLYPQEIAQAAQVLLRVLASPESVSHGSPPLLQVLVCSNNGATRGAMKAAARKFLDAPHALKTTGVSLGVTDEDADVPSDRFVFQKLFASKKPRAGAEPVAYDRTLIIKPSSLLAVYEAVYFKKPFVEKYVQVVLGAKDTFVVKVPIGLPLFYFITQFASLIPRQAEHFFTEDFIRREMLFDFSTPISKHFSHIFILTDKDFSTLYNMAGKYAGSPLVAGAAEQGE